MKHIVLRCIAGCLAAALAACASTGANREMAYGHGSAPNQQILITFHDERTGQVPVADPANGYRQRGAYGNSTWSIKVAERLAEEYGLQIVSQWPINTLGIHCVVYEVPANLSPDQLIKRLGQDERVEAAQAMQQFRSMAAPYDDPYYTLQADMRTLHIESAHHLATGRNIKIAVIDTGMDANHPDLQGKIAEASNFVPNSPANTAEIHGTAVAGIIAATANNHQGIVGMAPDSRLISLRACWQSGPAQAEASCNTLTLALALNAAINAKAQIINLSLAGPPDPLLGRLVRKALDEAIVVVAADTAKPGNVFPASLERVIAVRTAEAPGNPKPLDASHSTSAPGMEILTTLPHGSYNFMSGSSFAAAHVSGLAALLLERNPSLSPARIVSILNASISQRGNPQAVATIDACSAVASLGGGKDCPQPQVLGSLSQ